MSYFKAAL